MAGGGLTLHGSVGDRLGRPTSTWLRRNASSITWGKSVLATNWSASMASRFINVERRP